MQQGARLFSAADVAKAKQTEGIGVYTGIALRALIYE
jgi:hypothetical protein